MNNRSRLWMRLAAAALVFAPASTPAQNAAEVPASPPADEDVIGPDQLRDFSLNGAVTRPREPATPPAPAPASRPAAERPSSEPAARGAATALRGAETSRPAASSQREAESSAAVALPPAPADQPAAGPLAGSSFVTPPAPTPQVVPPAATDPLDDGPPLWPWFAAALLIGAGAGAYALRQRRQPGYAGAGPVEDMQESATPEPLPRVAAPATPEPLPRVAAPAAEPRPSSAAPAPAPSPAGPVGVVSTRLRPWLDVEFTPGRLVLTDERATLEFEISVLNSGAGPAREVLVEGALFSVGQTQDQEIAAFFAQPQGTGGRAPLIEPLRRIGFNTSVHLPRDLIRAVEIEGRPLLVPIAAFNIFYRFGSSEGQTSVSYLIGRDTKGEKMGPFRLDLGPRIFRDVSARPYRLGIRR